jgi:hypothetical protein
MATKTKTTVSINTYRKKEKVRRPGIHSKRKASKNKQSKNYLKRRVGQ